MADKWLDNVEGGAFLKCDARLPASELHGGR